MVTYFFNNYVLHNKGLWGGGGGGKQNEYETQHVASPSDFYRL